MRPLPGTGSIEGMTDEARAVQVSPELRIPWSELEFHATRAGGPGGQHVNRSATKVELWWNVLTSPSLTEDQRTRLLSRLATRIDQAGFLRLVSGARRSQLQNREAALERFQDLVAAALTVPRRRKPTRPTRSSVERRIAQKKRRGSVKRDRRKPGGDEG